jgi:hypothetical protein
LRFGNGGRGYFFAYTGFFFFSIALIKAKKESRRDASGIPHREGFTPSRSFSQVFISQLCRSGLGGGVFIKRG